MNLRCIHHRVEAHARTAPDARAVVFEHTSLTYGELDARANRVAHDLVARGVAPGAIVGVQLERSLDLIVALLGVLKAGAAYLPLDPKYPAERIAFMRADCRADVVVTSVPSDGPTMSLKLDVDPAQLAYVIYTSGSTGNPKGVMVSHENVARLFTTTEPWFHFEPRDVFSCHHSYAFDFSVFEIWGALMHGASVVIIPDDTRRAPDEFLTMLSTTGVTVLSQVPSSFRQVVAAAVARPAAAPLALRLIVFGGEALDLRSLAPWFARYGNVAQLVNMYGITETTVHVTYRVISPHECLDPKGSPIGIPLPDLEMYLLDENLRLADEGEIYVGGRGLAYGYYDRAGLTAERFVPDPFSSRAGDRLYKSGDLARRLPDGGYDYLGRNDAQVKIRGYRIETGEIASALGAHPSVREAVVVARDARLIAYVVSDAPVDDLRAYLGERLPSYMVPSVFVQIAALPITPSGKVDFNALPAPDTIAGRRAYVAPSTDAEITLAALWSSLLGGLQVGRDDRFFELGGHSLLAAEVASRLGTEHGVTLPVRLFLTSPTLAEAAAVLADAIAKRGVRDTRVRIEIPRRADVERAPLTFAQESIWIHEQVLQDVMRRTRSYVEGPIVRIRDRVNPAMLERALNEIAMRHESWRTSFVLDDEPMQVIGRSARIAIKLHPRRGLPVDQREGELERIAETLARQPFVLSQAPLVRCALVTFDDDDHVLVMVMHHLITDAWSEHLVAEELAHLYGMLAAGEPLPPRHAASYGDYAAWERGEGRAESREFWRTMYRNPPAPLRLPSTKATQTQPIRRRVPLGATGSAHLTAFAREHNVSRSAVLYAAFASVMAPSAEGGRLVLGVANANRTPTTERIVGCFSGVLPLVVDAADRPSLKILAQRLMATIADAVPHGALSLSEITKLAGRAPLVQLQASTQLAATSYTEGGVTFVEDFLPVSDAKFALKLIVQEQADQSIVLVWVADATHFDETALEGITTAFARVLGDGTTDETAQVDRRWFGGESTDDTAPLEWPTDTAIHHLVERRAKETPDARAVIFETSSLTYAELDARANRVAHYVVAQGVAPGAIVGVQLERSLDLVVALLGVLKAGAAYLPLDPSYPHERIAFMLEDCRVGVVITSATEVASQPTTSVGRHADPAQLAYVIYTSGSTGKPKGVLISHANVARLFTATQHWFHFDRRDVFSFYHSYAFDFSVFEIWGALIHGGSVVIVAEATRRSPDDFLTLLAKTGVTVLCQVPSSFRHLVAATRDVSLSLRMIVFGGEALSWSTIAPWFAKYGTAAQLINMYGITETTVHVTYRVISPDDKVISIGIPIPDLEMYVLDSALNRVPDGDEGELYVGGRGLAYGYHDRAGLTAERFVPDPFSGRAGDRLYKTGDVGRRLPDGGFEHLGRNDAQVKIRGYRIETGEITAVLSAHPDVREAAVVAREIGGTKRLVAYIAGAATSDALRAYLGERLPSYMVPSAFVTVDQLPVTPSGKIDLKALPTPEWFEAPATDAHVAPRTPDEIAVAALWSELLRVERVGVRDDFFASGGDSLLAIKLVARLRARFEVDVPLASVLASATVESIAAEVGRAKHTKTAAIAIQPRDRPLVASNAQERVWFVERMLAGPRPYNVAIAISIRGELDPTRLERALTEVVARHESWRSNFKLSERQLVHVIREPYRMELPTTTGDIDRLAREQAMPAYDLANDRLVRTQLVRIASDDHVLLVNVHHIVFDAASASVFAGELAALYDAKPLRPLTVQYADITHWQRAAVGDLDYWTAKLADAPTLQLATDRPRPTVFKIPGSHIDVRFPRPLTTSIRELARREGTSVFVILLAAFGVELAARTRQTDFVIATAVNNRNRPELETALGLLVNLIALRVDLSGDPSFRELLQRTRRTVLEGLAHQDVPFEKVVAALKRRDRSPIHKVALTVNRIPATASPAGQQWSLSFPQTGSATDDLDLQFLDDELDLTATFEYRADLFDRTTIERLARELQAILERVTADPDLPALAGTDRDVATHLAVLFAEVLQVPEVALDDSFFELGGHSLLVAHLQERIEQVLGIAIPLATIFEADTPARLAEAITSSS